MLMLTLRKPRAQLSLESAFVALASLLPLVLLLTLRLFGYLALNLCHSFHSSSFASSPVLVVTARRSKRWTFGCHSYNFLSAITRSITCALCLFALLLRNMFSMSTPGTGQVV